VRWRVSCARRDGDATTKEVAALGWHEARVCQRGSLGHSFARAQWLSRV
jgi:hypothetical protein